MYFNMPETLMDVAAILNTLHCGELVAEQQYWEHYHAVRGPFAGSLRSLLKEHAEGARQVRLELAQDITALGGSPTFRLNQVTVLSPCGDVTPLDMARLSSDQERDAAMAMVLRVVQLDWPLEEMLRELYLEAAKLTEAFDAGVADTLEKQSAAKLRRAYALRSLLV